MPLAINPNNYNIDFFQTQSFGEITDSNYLNYLFTQNLEQIAPELVNSPAGNFTNIYQQRGMEKDVNYKKLSNPGSIDEWLLEGNFPVNLNQISYQNPSQNLGVNQYGPPSLQAFNYENPQLIEEDTGFIQYPTSTGGNIGTTILGESLDAVGISSTNFIDFDSPLNTIAKERRSEEAKNRIRDGIIENTVGRINLDPFRLLTGQSLFEKNYKITKSADGVLGDALDVVSDIAGVNTLSLTSLFGGPLPNDAFDWYNPLENPFGENTIDISKSLLDRTGAGTKNLLFDALSVNKYGPIIEGQDQPINSQPKLFNSNQPTQKSGYLDYVDEVEPTDSASTPTKNAKNKIRGIINKIKNIDTNRNNPSQPTEFSTPTINDTPSKNLNIKGFEFNEETSTPENLKSKWDSSHEGNWKPQYNPTIKTGGLLDENDLIKNKTGSYRDNELFWKETGSDGSLRETNLPKKGLLAYTQKLIDGSIGESGSAAEFIGMPNSDKNYDGSDKRHITMSQGSLVKETKENKYYCRSWSVRNSYNTYSDLIRYDALWRDSQPAIKKSDGNGGENRKLGSYSTLREPGVPKIAWEYDDDIEKKIDALSGLVIGKEHIIPYMFSLENLAWKDSPQRRKLPKCEQGPHGGRIMWFPPYNINFTDNTSINWDTTTFIGRGEPIYTYNSTERTGTLSFTIIVDHPSIINKLKKDAFSTTRTNADGEEVRVDGSANLESFFAGCSTEDIREIVTGAFNEIIPPDELKNPNPNVDIVSEFIRETPQEINETLSFHFKNATSTIKESAEDNSKYANSSILSNSSCPDGVVGRCFDYNYETSVVDWYDNPRLYKGGSNLFGSNGECPEGGLVIGDSNEGDLVEIPLGGTSAMPITPPCNGKNTQSWGPKQSIVNEIIAGNESNRVSLWSNNGAGYKNENYCCEISLTGFTSGATTFTDLSKVGFYESRDGANQRFWGTGSYPFNNGSDQIGKGPTLTLPFTPEGGWKFSVMGDVPLSIGGAGTGISQLVEFLATTTLGKEYTINVVGSASNTADNPYNEKVGQDRANNVYEWMKDQLGKAEDELGVPKIDIDGSETIDLFSDKQTDKTSDCGRWRVVSNGKGEAVSTGLPGNDSRASKSGEFTLTPSSIHPGDYQNEGQLGYRRVDVYLTPNLGCVKDSYDKAKEMEEETILTEGEKNTIREQKNKIEAENEKERQRVIGLARSFVNECDYFEKIKKTDSFLYDSIADKLKNFHPAFHSITPEGFNERITFLQQCTRQGPSFIDPNQPQNTAFGRPPVCILRLGDFYFTKIIIDSINFTFDPLQWDLNPEGIGVQPMLVNVDLNFKFIGGSTLQGPLSQLQNAVSYNFFANTAIYKPIEKIITSRGDTGQLVTEGEEGFTDKANKTYYYGPWGSPDIDGVTTELNSVTTEDETLRNDLIEPKSPTPIKCTEGGQKKLSEGEIRILKNDTLDLTKYPLDKYDWWICDDGTNLTPLPKEESNPLNQTPGEDNTPTEEQEEQTSPNTTADDGNKIFAETKPNSITNVKNQFGEINISGDAYRGNSAGEGTLFQSGFNLLGVIPLYVYGALDGKYQSDFNIVITELVRGIDLAGSSVAGQSNAGILFNGQENNTNVPTNEGFSQIVAFNLFEFLTGFNTLEFWKSEYQTGQDFVIKDMETEIEKSGKVNFNVTFGVYADPTEEGKENGLTNQVIGNIKINGHITKEGVNKLKEVLSTS